LQRLDVVNPDLDVGNAPGVHERWQWLEKRVESCALFTEIPLFVVRGRRWAELASYTSARGLSAVLRYHRQGSYATIRYATVVYYFEAWNSLAACNCEGVRLCIAQDILLHPLWEP